MSENKSMNTVENLEFAGAPEKLSIGYCLRQLEKLQDQTDYLNNAILELGKIPSGNPGDARSPGDIAGQEKAKALGDMVRCRETTNQKLIVLYEKMYDDLMEKKTLKDRAMEIVETAVANGNCSTDDMIGLISEFEELIKA